jgi:hypothetical protein
MCQDIIIVGDCIQTVCQWITTHAVRRCIGENSDVRKGGPRVGTLTDPDIIETIGDERVGYPTKKNKRPSRSHRRIET